MEANLEEKKGLSELQKFTIALLRIAIGWHFLYEGLTKFYTPGWTAAGFLEMSSGPFARIFHAIAASPGMLQFVDFVKTLSCQFRLLILLSSQCHLFLFILKGV